MLPPDEFKPKTFSRSMRGAEKETAVAGLGRNVTLFDTTRAWAYKAIRFYRVATRSRLFDVWRNEVEDYALGINEIGRAHV